MNWYVTFIDLLIYTFILVMARHTFLRGAYFLHIFQQKGYKINEYWHWMIDHWNRRIVTPEHILYNLVILLMLVVMSDTVTGSAAILILCIFGYFWFLPFNYYRGEKKKKPLVFTPRMIRLSIPYMILALLIPVFITATAFIGYVPFTSISLNNTLLYSGDIYILSFGWVLADMLMAMWIFPAAMVMAPFEWRVHKHFIKLAKRKLAGMPDLKIIAITGSYGKTSTKFMIRDLLKERYRVCSTPGSYNTPMGICKVINNNLDAHHQVLILEMGARYEGNIGELCDIAQPDVSVVTNVGVAHLESFGSQEAIARTKSTIVSRLKENGTAVLNADDPLVIEMRTLRNDIQIVKAGIENGSVRAREIQYDQTGTHLKIEVEGQSSAEFDTKLLGKHNVQNLLLAVGVGLQFGLRLKTMALAASEIEPIEHRLELKKQGEIYVIDDAFNSNPVGAKNAVDILARFNSGRRIIVTPGMIELGEIQNEENRKFGKILGEAGLDLIILVGSRQTQPILEGIIETSFDKDRVKRVNSLFEANDIVESYIKPGDVVLYENDLPDSYNE